MCLVGSWWVMKTKYSVSTSTKQIVYAFHVCFNNFLKVYITLSNNYKFIYSVRFTPLLTGAGDSTMKVWNLATGDIVKDIDLTPAAPYHIASFCQDIGFCNVDQWAYTLSATNIHVWDLSLEQKLRRIELKDITAVESGYTKSRS